MLNTGPSGGTDSHFRQAASRLQNAFKKPQKSAKAVCLTWQSALPLGSMFNFCKLELNDTLNKACWMLCKNTLSFAYNKLKQMWNRLPLWQHVCLPFFAVFIKGCITNCCTRKWWSSLWMFQTKVVYFLSKGDSFWKTREMVKTLLHVSNFCLIMIESQTVRSTTAFIVVCDPAGWIYPLYWSR